MPLKLSSREVWRLSRPLACAAAALRSAAGTPAHCPPSECLPHRRMQQFIRQAYSHEWLCLPHEPDFGDEEGEAGQGEEAGPPPQTGTGGFTLRRK